MQKILDEIRKAHQLLDLVCDWDGDDAEKADLESFNEAMIFMHNIAKDVENIIIPDIGLCRDGSVDIDFNNLPIKAGLLINFEKNRIGYFGEANDTIEDTIKGSQLDYEVISQWLKKHMVEH